MKWQCQLQRTGELRRSKFATGNEWREVAKGRRSIEGATVVEQGWKGLKGYREELLRDKAISGVGMRYMIQLQPKTKKNRGETIRVEKVKAVPKK